MRIYRPVKTDRISQRYGENNVCAKIHTDGKPILPFKIVNKTNGSCPNGFKDFYKLLGLRGHAGTDFVADKREPVYFDIDAGVEWEAIPTFSATAGHGVLIRSLEPIPLDEAPVVEGATFNLIKRQYEELGGKVHLMRYYGHFDEATHLTSRQRVKFGDKVGLAGTSGASTGVHVHRHLFVCGPNDQNPFFYLDGDSDMKGRIDEDQWFENRFVHAAPQPTAVQLALMSLIAFLTAWRDII